MPETLDHLRLMARFLFQAFPGVNRELEGWRRLASRCPDPELRRQALASLALKRFHCQGASVFAVWQGNCHGELLRAIVALQTISDYLDNLCDRAGVQEEEAFQQLHQAFLDAVTPGADLRDYYTCYPYRQDGGYLAALVEACQQCLGTLPSYAAVQEKVRWLAELYCHLQAKKHVRPDQRENRLVQWLAPLLKDGPESLYWWELAAATGSTLGLFALTALAARPQVWNAEVEQLTGAYFPWIGGLHILLDYYIDRQEDREGHDLNFTTYYPQEQEAASRLEYFLQRSLEKCLGLPEPFFHLTVVRGLLAMYLSDAKVAAQRLTATRRTLLSAGGFPAQYLFWLCVLLRRAGAI
ncbi:tetraprenyl-beta-curcumene synthase family protein [Moorellaceae bacterium AZ2]